MHSNESADNTQYNVDGNLFDTPPPGAKTHLASFSPNVRPLGGRPRPEWRINTATRVRTSWLSCHGAEMDGLPCRPDNGGDDSPTIP